MGLGLHFTGGSWLGHLSFLLLLIALLAPSRLWLRAGFVASSAVGLCYAAIYSRDMGHALWMGALLATSLALLARYALGERSARFNEEEEALRHRLCPELSRASARHLIDRGNWINGKAGETLIREDEPISHLFYMVNGEAGVSLHGKWIASCGADDLIGDVTVLSGEPASGTVVLNEDSRFWCVSAPQLRQYLDLHSDVRTAIERQINAALDEKLRTANKALAGE
ncbi:MAG: cyclic nucleotide-binding domain-containing protein [Blastomonas sp.]